MYINVAAAKKMRLGEILSLRVTIFNLWSQQMDVLISVKGSSDYNFIQINRDGGDTDTAVPGEQQVSELTSAVIALSE